MFKLCVLAAFVALAAADVAFLPLRPPQKQYSPYPRILSSESNLSPEGNYNWAYETENGINAQEQGQVRQLPAEQAVVAQGSYHYTSPEGVPVDITYVADENGFQPSGSAIPTPPPVPAAILRSIEYNRAHPEPQTPQQPQRFAF